MPYVVDDLLERVDVFNELFCTYTPLKSKLTKTLVLYP